MNRRFLPAMVIGLAAIALAACTEDTRRPVSTVSSPSCDTSFSVVNNSSQTVRELYYSHSSRGSWDSDQLGSSVLPPGRAINRRAINTGNYDFRVVWTNGRAAEIRQVNICRASRITITDRGLVAS
jgi:hypothetical protein